MPTPAEMRRLLAANEGKLKQIVLDAGGLIDANNVATVDTPFPWIPGHPMPPMPSRLERYPKPTRKPTSGRRGSQ